MTSQAVLYEESDGVAVLTLNQPDTRNAITEDITQELVSLCERINEDMNVGCVIVTGAGESFSSGGNVKEMRDKKGYFAGSPAQIRRSYLHGIQKIPLAFQAIEVPTIAAVNGHAIGAGCDLALCCDIRIASEDAIFAESFLRVGLVSGDGGAWLLPRAIGLSRAYEMTFTGNFINAGQAAEWGLVSRSVPAGNLMEEAQTLAQAIARQPRHSLRMTKKLMRESMAMTLGASLEMAASMQAIVQHTKDQHEAVVALLDKRKPVFTGE